MPVKTLSKPEVKTLGIRKGNGTEVSSKAVTELAEKIKGLCPSREFDGSSLVFNRVVVRDSTELQKHVRILVNVISAAEELAKRRSAVNRIVVEKAAKEGMRVALVNQEDRYADIDGKYKRAAILLLSKPELAIKAAERFIELRVKEAENSMKAQYKREYKDALDALKEAAK